MIARLPILLSLAILIVIGVVRADPSDDIAIGQYHEKIAQMIHDIPMDYQGWVGRDVPLPQSATNLLKPNAIVAREYMNQDRGVIATLMIVQCKDARDMAGHYPPVCYPANGWIQADDMVGRKIDSGEELTVYGFHRVVGRVEREMTIYSLFALPTGVLTGSMGDVRKLSANYTYRKYGAAQLQVLINGDISPADHQWILEDMYQLAKPTLDAVIDAQVGQADEGGL